MASWIEPRREAIAKMLEHHCMERKQLAERIGVSRSYISMMLKGERGVREDTAKEIARVLDMPLDALFILHEDTTKVEAGG